VIAIDNACTGSLFFVLILQRIRQSGKDNKMLGKGVYVSTFAINTLSSSPQEGEFTSIEKN